MSYASERKLMEITQYALDTLSKETSGLEALSELFLLSGERSIADSFGETVKLCEQIAGTVIVTGMGKSGHIARKISSTLASTGTRSNFIHPAEASHGDLGMIGKNDLIIALSNSGNTPELSSILSYAKRFSIALIAITSQAQSELAKYARVSLILPAVPEACSITKAPTTSTIMMLALGDALAVTLLKRRGFTTDDFHVFHPGGKLGAALKRVADVMHHTKDIPLCAKNTSLHAAVKTMSAAGYGCIGIVDKSNSLVGMLTDGDIRRNFATASPQSEVGDVMTSTPVFVSKTDLIVEVLSLFQKHKITVLFVVDEANTPVGLLHIQDFLSLGVL